MFRAAAQRDIAAARVRDLALGPLFNTWLGLLHHYVTNRDLFAEGKGPVLAARGPQLVEHFMAMVRA
jgi:hypothetical protein